MYRLNRSPDLLALKLEAIADRGSEARAYFKPRA